MMWPLEPFDVADLGRLANLSIGMLNFVWLAVKTSGQWSKYDSLESRALAVSLILLTLSSVYATGEAIAQELEPGPRIGAILVAQVSLTVALWLNRHSTITGMRRASPSTPEDAK